MTRNKTDRLVADAAGNLVFDPGVSRLCQESKDHADVGWILEFGPPDEFISKSNGDILLRYGNIIVDMDACTDGIRYDEFAAIMAARKTPEGTV